MKSGWQVVELCKYFEGIHDGDLSEIGLQPKLCPANVWTIGYGHALINKVTGKFLTGKKDFHLIAEQYPDLLTITREEAENMLITDLVQYEKIVNKYLKIEVNQSQYDALVSFVYNCGYSKTLFSTINAKSASEIIGNWWRTHYIGVGKNVLTGLVKRRACEATLFETSKLVL